MTSVPETALVRGVPPRAKARLKPLALPVGFEELRARCARAHHGDSSQAGSSSGQQASKAAEHAPLVPVTTTLTPSPEAACATAAAHLSASAPGHDGDPLASVPVTTTLTPSPEAACATAPAHLSASATESDGGRPELASASAQSVPDASEPSVHTASPAGLPASDARVVPGEEPGPARVPQAAGLGSGLPPRALDAPAVAKGTARVATVDATHADRTLGPAASERQVTASKGVETASPSSSASSTLAPSMGPRSDVVVALPQALVAMREVTAAPATAGSVTSAGATDLPPPLPLSLLPSVVMQVVRQGALPRAVTLHLEPKELGEVQLQVQAVGADIHVQIGARNPETRILVGSLLEDLARQLSHDLGSRDEGHREQPQGPPGTPIGPSVPRVTHSSSVEPAASGLVDLRL